MSSQSLYFTCRIDEGAESKIIESELKMPSLMLAGDLDQEVVLPPPLPPIRLVRYLPLARFNQVVEPDPDNNAPPVIQVSIDGPKLSYQRWLVAGDPARNRLSSLIGTWRYVAACDEKQRDELYAEFEGELERDPRLIVSRLDGQKRCELTSAVGDVHQLNEQGCIIRILDYYPYYTRDNQTQQPVNLSDQRINPAVHVEIEQGGVKEDRWVFTLFPDYDHDKTERLPLKILFDCPVENKKDESPQYTIVTVGLDGHEVWMRHGDEVRSQMLTMAEEVTITNSQYAFHLSRFAPSGRLIESYVSTDDSKEAVTVMKIETMGKDGASISEWLVLGNEKRIQTHKGTVSVVFGSKTVKELENFQR